MNNCQQALTRDIKDMQTRHAYKSMEFDPSSNQPLAGLPLMEDKVEGSPTTKKTHKTQIFGTGILSTLTEENTVYSSSNAAPVFGNGTENSNRSEFIQKTPKRT